MAMGHQFFFLGDISSNGWFSSVTLLFRGVAEKEKVRSVFQAVSLVTKTWVFAVYTGFCYLVI